jgi:hypothetical protein
LQRAETGSPLLVTTTADGRSGVEVRDTPLDLHAGLRIADRHGALPSNGWQLPLEGIDAVLHLPYGYRLIGANGVDRSPDSWIAQWSLLDLFVVALIALLAGRLLGGRWAVVAVVFLALSQHEPGVPRWTLAAALALALLRRALPAGRLRSSAQALAAVALIAAGMWTLPFARAQLESALHPQLEHPGNSGEISVGAPGAEREITNVAAGMVPATNSDAVNGLQLQAASKALPAEQQPEADAAAPMPAPPPADTPHAASMSTAGGGSGATDAALEDGSITAALKDIDTHSVLQAGGGELDWDVGNDYRLGWSGPVSPVQTMQLVIAPAWLVRGLRVLMLASLIVLWGRVLKGVAPSLHTGRRRGALGRASAAVILLACVPHLGHAQATPSDSLLNQLRTRLTEAPACAPQCAVVASASMQANNDQVTLELEVHAGAVVALPLPQTDAGMQLVTVSVDGNDRTPIAQNEDQLQARLMPGVHRMDLVYLAQPVDSTTLSFPLRPQWFVFHGQRWALNGLDGGRLLGDSVTLTRLQAAADGTPTVAAQQACPPYVRLTRTLVLGVDWRVDNTVERLAPSDSGFTLDLPLLPGEHPLGDGVHVHDGKIGVTFNAGQNEVRWSSRLDRTDPLSIHAPALADHAEVWRIHPAMIWHVEATGVPLSDSDNGLSFEPLPGETLQLTVTRPAPSEGNSLAFDAVDVSSQVGDRATDTTLTLRARSTRGGDHTLSLPTGTTLLDATRDDQSLNLAKHDSALSLPLQPGVHTYVLRLREPLGARTRTATPGFALAAPSANITLGMTLPPDRWVLWTSGPLMGPAVLYWAQLAVLLLAAGVLARYAPTPLRFHHWLLLGLGFSAFAWSAYALVALWLILLGLRVRFEPVMQPLQPRQFNALQGGLAVITLLALAVLVSVVPNGLLGVPDMHVAGNGSTAWALRWFADQARDTIPQAHVYSVPLGCYKVAMLAWALWLANALIGWLRWGFDAWTRGGYWRRSESRPAPSAPATTIEEPLSDP